MFRAVARKIRNKIFRLHPGGQEVPLFERKGYETIYDDETMAVLQIPGRGEECIVSFTGVGHALGGIDLQTPEFSHSDMQETKIFVIDKQRSWGNNIDWERLIGIVDELTKGMRVTTLGNSMGGFLAILAAHRLGATQAVAFAPQWSIDPAIVPDEKRWGNYRSKITQLRYPDLSSAFQTQTQFTVFFGDDPLDATHLGFFPTEKNNLDLIVLSGGGHSVAAFLKDKRQLYPAIQACRMRQDVRKLLIEANINLMTV